jgi:hypothetical protein
MTSRTVRTGSCALLTGSRAMAEAPHNTALHPAMRRASPALSEPFPAKSGEAPAKSETAFHGAEVIPATIVVGILTGVFTPVGRAVPARRNPTLTMRRGGTPRPTIRRQYKGEADHD